MDFSFTYICKISQSTIPKQFVISSSVSKDLIEKKIYKTYVAVKNFVLNAEIYLKFCTTDVASKWQYVTD